jgi:hypothetical protein
MKPNLDAKHQLSGPPNAGLGVASLAFALWYGAAAWPLAPHPF